MSEAFAVPELTRGLRTFAAPRALGGLHDRFFAPLIEARRAAARAGRWNDRLTAFDAERLDATLRAVIESTAAERHPDSDPDRRALAARVTDLFAPTFASLSRVRVAADAVRASADDASRGARWSQWIAELRLLFGAADLGWESAEQILR